MGIIIKFIYETVSKIGTEPEAISYYAISIIVMTVLFKIIMMPIMLSSTRSQKKLAEIQPEVQKLQKRYSYDPEILQRKTMELYKEKNVKITGGCLPLIIQFIIMIALYRVMMEPAKYMFEDASAIHSIRTNFLWIPQLTQADPYWYGIPLINALSQFLVSKLTMSATAQNNPQAQSMQMMQYMMPVMFFFMLRNFAAGLGLYWLVGNIVEIVVRGTSKLRYKKGEQADEVSHKKGKDGGGSAKGGADRT